MSFNDSYTINIKRIRNKYDINLNIIVDSTPFSIIHEGYKLNTIEMNEVIIETIPLKNQIFSLKITHPYIIETEEVLCDQNNLYIIYPNYKKYHLLILRSCFGNVIKPEEASSIILSFICDIISSSFIICSGDLSLSGVL